VFYISYIPFPPTNKLSRREIEVCIKKNLVDVFLVGPASEIFRERFSVTQTLEGGVHETRVTCRERLLEFTERLLELTKKTEVTEVYQESSIDY
jgi:hypothetical protein